MWAPTTGKVETNVVTDPSSVALTLELDAFGRGRPARPGLHADDVAHHAVAEAGPGRRLDDLRAARPRLLDDRRQGAGAPARLATSPSRQNGDGRAHLKALAKAGLNTVHLLPTLRHRLHRGGPGEAADAAVRPRLVRSRQRPAAEVRRRRRRQGRLQLGLRPLPLDSVPDGSYASSRQAADGGAARRRVPHHGRGAAPGRAAGRARPGLQPHRRVGPGRTSRCSTRSCPATTSGSTRPVPSRPRRAARTSRRSTRWREKLMVDSVVVVGPELPRRRLPLRPHGTPQQGQHARGALGARRPDAREGRRGRQVHLPLRRGLELRRGGRTTSSSSRRRRDSSAARASAPSPTVCATGCAAAARSTRTRVVRASAPARPPTPTGRRSTPTRPPGSGSDTDLVQLGLAGNLKSFTFRSQKIGSRRQRHPGRLQRIARRLRRPA